MKEHAARRGALLRHIHTSGCAGPIACTYVPLAFCIRTSCMCTETGRYSHTLSQWQRGSNETAKGMHYTGALHNCVLNKQLPRYGQSCCDLCFRT